ncbi:PQQ-dependent sugar dehydrogenase [Williamsia deligens]|uniref:PQQ-dependent sugar dehydrogenase n=1 Tax=Williamsia deligens TaxID=321325 RepID=A0ABW3G809_9NOCA|nr:PQQ-dependent sugar dehydrogenase [Williamsia deligens]MCP2192645.1 Glucose/arabinose dehydrogenase, beta-propeller fold [Williamsia deligens]
MSSPHAHSRRLLTTLGAVAALGVGLTTAVGPVRAAPALTATTIASGLDKPWDVEVAPDGTIVTGERSGRFVAVRPGGAAAPVRADQSSLFVTNEAGLMGLALDRGFTQNRTLYSCQAEKTSGGAVGTGSAGSLPIPFPNTGQEIRVVAWRVAEDWSAMTRTRTVLSGIPVNSGGRHAGCGLTAAPDGTLWIGTGDNAVPSYPQSRTSLGGKVLHVTTSGAPAAGTIPGTPIYSLGHRNVQGVALQPGTGRVYSIEQGTSRDDELNLLQPGGNYGYRPDRAPLVYDESVPMTDPVRVPGAIGAVWSSGAPTLATPALTFLPGGWGDLSGAAVVATQQGKRLLFLTLSDDGRQTVRRTDDLRDTYGRLRGLGIDRDGSLLVTTDNGGGGDRILRVRPPG